MLLEKIISKN